MMPTSLSNPCCSILVLLLVDRTCRPTALIFWQARSCSCVSCLQCFAMDSSTPSSTLPYAWSRSSRCRFGRADSMCCRATGDTACCCFVRNAALPLLLKLRTFNAAVQAADANALLQHRSVQRALGSCCRRPASMLCNNDGGSCNKQLFGCDTSDAGMAGKYWLKILRIFVCCRLFWAAATQLFHFL